MGEKKTLIYFLFSQKQNVFVSGFLCCFIALAPIVTRQFFYMLLKWNVFYAF